MLNISSIYPKKEGYTFDFDYYLNKHMPMSIDLLSNAKGFKGVSVEKGIDIEEPKIESSYVAMCHYYFVTFIKICCSLDMIEMNDIVISKAVKDDAAFIFSCVKNLAEYVNQLDYMSSTKKMIENELFKDSCNSSVLIASQNDKKMGFILYYTTFSTFKGRKGLYIGDLYVIPEYRKKGIGKKLFQAVVDEAIENKFCRVEWYVTNSNENAIKFYEKSGAKRLTSKSLFSLEIE